MISEDKREEARRQLRAMSYEERLSILHTAFWLMFLGWILGNIALVILILFFNLFRY